VNRYKLNEPRKAINFNPFDVGDRVIVKDQFAFGGLAGQGGTIMTRPDYDKVGVQWDYSGHTTIFHTRNLWKVA